MSETTTQIAEWTRMLEAAIISATRGAPGLRDAWIEALSCLAESARRNGEAVRWIGVVSEELVLAGGAGGDRTVALSNLRALVGERDALRSEVERLRHLFGGCE